MQYLLHTVPDCLVFCALAGSSEAAAPSKAARMEAEALQGFLPDLEVMRNPWDLCGCYKWNWPGNNQPANLHTLELATQSRRSPAAIPTGEGGRAEGFGGG